LKRHKQDNQEEGGGSKGETQGVTPIVVAKRKSKSGGCTNMMKGAINTNHPSPFSLLLNCQVLMGKVILMYI